MTCPAHGKDYKYPQRSAWPSVRSLDGRRTSQPIEEIAGVKDHIMVSRGSLLVFFCVAFSIGVQLTSAQHWSYGWYPGGKREIASPGNLEGSEESKLCDGGSCPDVKVPRDQAVKHLLAGILTGQLHRKK